MIGLKGSTPSVSGTREAQPTGATGGAERSAVLVVAPLGYVASISFFMELVGCLSGDGIKVSIITLEDLDPPLDYINDNVSVARAPSGGNGLVHKGRVLVWLLRKIRRSLRQNPDIKFVFGLSQAGVVLSWIALMGRSECLVYLNDELWFNDYGSHRLYQIRKCLERASIKRASVVVTQDRDRGRLLTRINRIARGKIECLPNSRRGSASIRRTKVVHDLVGCPHDAKIVLWMGAATEGDGALEIARQATTWPSEYMFVYHFRSKAPSDYKQKLVELNGVGRNKYIESYFSYSDLEDIYASAHIGVAYYPKRGLNAEYIGLSSGKLNTFLKAGVPCVVSTSRGLAWAVRSAGCVAIDTMADLWGAIKVVEQTYDERTRCAVATYNRRLNFEPHYEKLVSRLAHEEKFKRQ